MTDVVNPGAMSGQDAPTSAPPVGSLEMRDVSVHFSSGLMSVNRSVVRAVEHVDLEIPERTIVALVGESGCGKSTLGRVALGLQRPTTGELRLRAPDGTVTERWRGHGTGVVQAVFQDPAGSLNPRQRVGTILIRALRHGSGPFRGNPRQRALELLAEVGLRPADEFFERFPHELSGGQQQRVAIARAVGMQPRLIVADEPVSALDVSVRAQIMGLFRRLRDEHGVGVLLISHDLGTVRAVADEVVVMYLGRIVERGVPAEVFADPRHPYTQALIAAVPSIYNTRSAAPPVRGEPPSATSVPSGCAFHPRCALADERCRTELPVLVRSGRRTVACHVAAASIPSND